MRLCPPPPTSRQVPTAAAATPLLRRAAPSRKARPQAAAPLISVPGPRDFRGSQPDDGLGRGAAGARTPRGQPERNRERRAGRAAGWRGRGLGLRERGSDAGHVRAAARRPVHLSVRARGQGADQRGRAARARVPAAQPFGAAPPAPDRLLRALQDAGRRADRAAPEQSGRADHLGAQPGAARARQRTEREIPRQAAHPDPGGDRHGASGLCALLHLFPGHKIQRPDSGAAAWGELLAHGVSNLISSLFSCFPNSATLATTSLLVDAGGNTQLAGLFSCIVVLSVLLWLGPFFYYLPKAVLACINISSMRQMFFQMQELPQLWRISRMDFAVWMVTWVAVVILSVDLGLAIGVVFSMMTVVCRTQRVQCLALGLAEGTELYRPLRESHKLRKARGLCVLSYPAPLYFGTRGQFRRSLEWQLGLGEAGKEAPKADGPPDAAAEPVRVVVLDCSGITFADAAGAREVVQLASRCRDAGIHLLLAQCHGEGGVEGGGPWRLGSDWTLGGVGGGGEGHSVVLGPKNLTRLSSQPQCWGH
uniref:Solute carrier family 26 member 10 n=1 Tax=Canis lupus familiaris TaxID=9615 RepID=A0A8P0NXD4_CANLF